MKKFIFSLFLMFSSSFAAQDVPSLVKEFVEKMPKSYVVERIVPSKERYNVQAFEVWFRDDIVGVRFPGYLFYDDKNKVLFVGSLISLENGKQVNLTRRKLLENRKYIHYDFSKIDLKKCLKLGTSGKKIFVVLDPLCPHCRKQFGEIKELASEGKGTFYVLFYPVHKQRSEFLIAYVLSRPEKERVEALNHVFSATSQELKQLEDKGKELLKKKKINELLSYHKKTVQEFKAFATPTFFLPDGTKEVGFMKRTKEVLGIEEQKSKGDKR